MGSLGENAEVVAPVKAGDILADKYCVQRVLGVGGMGVVVAAEHLALHQNVALKFMLPEVLENEQAVERFMREARLAVRLRSEHVAKVMDVGCMENGAPYIVMEFLEGEDLDAVIRRDAPMESCAAVDFVLQACMAMAEAHSLGIVHRDLKPANLFVTKRPDGSPMIKVLDFGISKVHGHDDTSQTASSVAMGSPGYMAPEQMRSAKHADHRADIWALGVILYQLLSKRKPFEAESTPVIFAAVLTGDSTPLVSVLPDVDPELAAVVHRCLQRERDKRYASVSELAQALLPFGDSRALGMAESIARLKPALAISSLPEDSEADATLGMDPQGARAGLPATYKSDSELPAKKSQTTHRASAGQVIVTPVEVEESERPRRLGVVLGVVAAGAVGFALLLTQGSSSDGGGADDVQAPTTSSSAASAGSSDPVPTIDAGVPDAMPLDASLPDAAPVERKRVSDVPIKPTRRKRKPQSDEPKSTHKPKDPPNVDPFGTMQ